MFIRNGIGVENARPVIIGAGPAGLSAATELSRAGLRTVVLEKSEAVGGLARTVCYKGCRFDLGGHRFFTKVASIRRFWQETLGSDFIRRQRVSRIYYNGKYVHYPIRPWNVLRTLGPVTAARAVLSYLTAYCRPRSPEVSLEDYIINRFGRVLYEAFFRTYTEKVWGTSCAEISADWAAQRIKGLSLYRALRAAVLPGRAREIKSLINCFDYPRLGPGQMWEAVSARVSAAGTQVLTGMEVVSIRHNGRRVTAVEAAGPGGTKSFRASHVISSMPLCELIEKLCPPPPAQVLHAARSLRYRDFLVVALIIEGDSLFPDNWIYIHDPGVRVGRIQNFINWSPDMVPDSKHTCLGLEYFCFQGDSLWAAADRDLLQLAAAELERLHLASRSAVLDGKVERVEKAYPIYNGTHKTQVRTIRDYLKELPNLQTVGRNGMHKYNNQDHSMLTAFMAGQNILGANHDIWSINIDNEYQEDTDCAIDGGGRRRGGLHPKLDLRLSQAGRYRGR